MSDVTSPQRAMGVYSAGSKQWFSCKAVPCNEELQRMQQPVESADKEDDE
jgi:hypothetical protein